MSATWDVGSRQLHDGATPVRDCVLLASGDAKSDFGQTCLRLGNSDSSHAAILSDHGARFKGAEFRIPRRAKTRVSQYLGAAFTPKARLVRAKQNLSEAPATVASMPHHDEPPSKTRVDKAGSRLRGQSASPAILDPAAEEIRESDIAAVNAYRRSYSDPLLKVRMGLSSFKTTIGCPDAAITQRTKRYNRIVAKLVRFPHQRLSQMQDVGGVRVVLSDLPRARRWSAGSKNSGGTRSVGTTTT